ncbi:hypothetical protein HY380_01825 [Candidatus Saccharibacteria bacterium]|nr:hypothetical protein [Candidatus Saccharibacteria bacterium]
MATDEKPSLTISVEWWDEEPDAWGTDWSSRDVGTLDEAIKYLLDHKGAVALEFHEQQPGGGYSSLTVVKNADGLFVEAESHSRELRLNRDGSTQSLQEEDPEDDSPWDDSEA